MPLLSAAFHFAPAGGGITRSATAWRAAASANGAAPASLCFLGNGRQGAKGRLRLCRSAAGDGWTTTPRCPGDLIPAERWWEPELRPEDLVEPTGKGVEELKAIRDTLLREPLRPVSLAVQEVVATGGNVFRCQCFHVGVLSGPLLLMAGLCKLYTVAPNLFMDIVLGYIFYKLSVLAANLKRNGRANDICARMQFVLMLILIVKRNNPIKDSYYHFTEFFWGNAFQVYGVKVYCECVGLEHPRQELEGLFKAIMSFFKKILKTICGID